MKKSSKNLMKIVAILLCLVLATSSIVSTTLAKFVVTKDATTSIKFDTFGLQIDVSSKTGHTEWVQQGDSAIITYSSLAMHPGVNEDNALRFYLTENQPTVPVKLVVTVDVEIADACMVTLDGLVGNTDTAYMPIAFNVGTVEDKDGAGWLETGEVTAFKNDTSILGLETAIENALAAEIKDVMGSGAEVSGTSVTKSFVRANGKPDGAVPAVTFDGGKRGIAFGFDWPLENGVENGNLIETYIANQLGGTTIPVTVKYTVSFEQTAA